MYLHYTGIIPAHAGFTTLELPPVRDNKDHPRTRGVYPGPRGGPHASAGSSPHTRGLPAILPRAGGQRADHPRTRGVYGDLALTGEHVAGSSPHTRGLLLLPSVSLVLCWIIPAHAGFTPPAGPHVTSPADHPRTRGVYWSDAAHGCRPTGSSPHTRGLPACVIGVTRLPRIIPAHAGFTRGRSRPRGSPQDHPRTRGVYPGSYPPCDHLSGSSPHTRGLPPAPGRRLCIPRIIPAHAGFTSVRSVIVISGPDHPRTRGVYRLA